MIKNNKDIIGGKYKILDTIGKGGMSTVYKVINLNFNKVWAIKQVRLNRDTPIDFLAEPKILKDLDHPALPRIVDIIYEEDFLYIVLDFIDGTSLDTFLDQSISIPETKIITWAKDLCDVLNYLHTQEQPIIYRDMKPSNIMLTKDGRIKLIDFGIARQYKENSSADTVVIGTRGYAAPEQYGNHQTDARTDIYSLGVTLYHLATGKGPNDPPYELLPVRQINPKLSEGLEHIIKKCTEQDPKMRYQSVKELQADFNNIEKLSNSYIISRRRKRGKYFIASFILSSILTGLGTYRVISVQNNEYLSSVEKASLYNKNGDEESSLAILDNEIKDMPKRTEAYFEKAKVYISNAEYTNAINFLTIEALDSNKKIVECDEYNYLLGLACFSKSNYKNAYECFSKINGGNFKGLKYYMNISEFFSNPSKVSENDSIVQEIENLKGYLDGLDDNEDKNEKLNGYIILADIYGYNPKIFDHADDKQINILEEAKSKNLGNDNVTIYNKLGQAYYLKALTNFNNDEEYNKYLNLALDNYNTVEKLGYSSSSTYINIGIIYKNLKNYDKAQTYFHLLVENYPNDCKGYIQLAKLAYQIEGSKSPEQRNYSDFKKYYQLAEENNTIDNNFELEDIKKLYNDVKDK